MSIDPESFETDMDTFGDAPGVNVYNFPDMSREELS